MEPWPGGGVPAFRTSLSRDEQVMLVQPGTADRFSRYGLRPTTCSLLLSQRKPMAGDTNLDTEADEALEAARSLPSGPEKVEALKKARTTPKGRRCRRHFICEA
jgi:hypothetical protein